MSCRQVKLPATKDHDARGGGVAGPKGALLLTWLDGTAGRTARSLWVHRWKFDTLLGRAGAVLYVATGN